jgi:hypothetical protein
MHARRATADKLGKLPRVRSRVPLDHSSRTPPRGIQEGQWWEACPASRYYYKVLVRQGRNAPGGAKNYLLNCKMNNGFAFLAYPAEYRASGVMTFMINPDRVIVQKDLGSDTVRLAGEIAEYIPDKTWQEVDG